MEPPASASEISGSCSNGGNKAGDDAGLRRGPWTVDEDLLLVNYIESHGEGRWNSLAHSAGLKRTGKSCRLRWMNYLRPDVRHGNITPEEQLLILELHSRWGNRWSKIAQQLPGRTDNEIKNYWRTKVQKGARQLNCGVDSKRFRDVVHYIWVPRLIERIHSAKIDQQIIHRQNPDVVDNDTSPQAVEPVERLVGYEHQNTMEMDQTMPYNIWSVDDFWSLQQILQ